jgi:hypothetical protein
LKRTLFPPKPGRSPKSPEGGLFKKNETQRRNAQISNKCLTAIQVG